jgi:cAMP deaminase
MCTGVMYIVVVYERGDSMTDLEFLKVVPKTEIHIHIEAVSPAETYMVLNQRHGIDRALDTIESIRDLLQISSLDDMIKNFIFLQTFVRTEEDYSLMVEDICKYAKANNVWYCEAHFSISLPKQRGLDVRKILRLMEAQLEDYYEQSGIDIRLIVDVSRTFGFENAAENLSIAVELISESRSGRIIAVGLGGMEKEGDIDLYQPVFSEAATQGIRCVAHAGEVASARNINDAIVKLGAERIGHGVSAAFDDEIRDLLVQQQVPIEVCISSNIQTGKYFSEYENHPVRQFFTEGLNISINSDDPFLFDTTITDEYKILYEKLGFSIPEIMSILSKSIDSCFVPKETKHALRNRLLTFYARWAGSPHL